MHSTTHNAYLLFVFVGVSFPQCGQSSSLVTPGSDVLTQLTAPEYHQHGGRIREALGADNGVGTAGITQHTAEQRTGAGQRNSA